MTKADARLVVFGLGYVGSAVARAAASDGFVVAGATRSVDVTGADAGMRDASAVHRRRPTRRAIRCCAATPRPSPPRRICAGSATCRRTGVYGDRGGAWVDEDTVACADRRTAAGGGWTPSRRWRRLADRYAVDLFRLAGIYGPGRSAFDDLRAGTARRIVRPGHQFGRIHRDDIVRAVMAAMRAGPRGGVRVLHLADDEPAESADVVAEAARLLGVAAAAGRSPFDRRGGHDEPHGAQLLGGEPQGGQPADPAAARPALAVPELSRGTTRHPGARSGGERPAVAGRGPAARDSRWSPSFTRSPGRPGR